MTSTIDLGDWTPIRVSFSGATPMVDWCYTGDTQFTEPFFDQTIEHCFRRPFSLLFRQTTPISDVERVVVRVDEPAGFVFHASRCGSTLLAQMMSALPGVHVLSEPPPVDTILRAPYTVPGVTREQLVAWVRTLVLALSRPGSRSVYKFDSWTTISLALLREAFPDVPWVFLYRDPAEIVSSQLRRRGAHMIPGVLPPALFGMDPREAVSMRPDDYCARVLAAILAAALEQLDGSSGGSLAANYRRLPAIVLDEVVPLFSLDCPDGDRRRVLDVARWDAKNPSLLYEGGNAARPSPAEADAAARWAGPVYERLEALR